MSDQRRFATTEDDVARVVIEWREGLFSSLEWRRDPHPPKVAWIGASKGYFACTEGFPFKAFLKPTTPMPIHTPWPAVEKIAADLAIDVGLPVPPVLLYRRTGVPTGVEERTCISLVMGDFDDWPPDWNPSQEEQQLIDSALPCASGIVALDTYLGNQDRNDRRPNAVFYKGRKDQNTGWFSFLDFANCLNRQDCWLRRGWRDVRVYSVPTILRKALELDLLFQAVDRIENITDQQIDGVVGRIPDDFLTTDRKEVVSEALKDRRELVREVLSAEFG